MTTDTIVTSQPTTSTEIQFRPKKFGNKIPEELHDKFVQAVLAVNSMTEDEALDTIWKLTYNPELVLRAFGFTSIEPTTTSEAETENVHLESHEDLDFISEDIIKSFRNELRYQRTLIDTNFPEISVPDSCKEAFEALNNATAKDIITSVIVFSACSAHVNCYTEDTINRSLALLKSPCEKNFFGGIRSLHFSYEEALSLKSYAPQIAELLSAMWKEKKSRYKPNTPLEKLGQLLQKRQELNAEQQPVEVPTNSKIGDEEAKAEEEPSSATSNLLTANAILANLEVFESFLEGCNKVKKAGFDPALVVSKLEAISKILDGLKDLS